jgi:3-oxoacyl-[acyl-carrier-protein] synthase III
LSSVGKGMAIVGCGSATPDRIVSNDELAQIVDTSDEWISTRTGIKRRHLSEGESLSQLAAKAASAALEMARIAPTDVDLIILSTSTPDDLFGSACRVQSLLGATKAVAFDLTAACSGFVFGLNVAAQFIRTGVYQNILVIGGDILSRWVNWQDRNTCVLFGDGAGAVVCRAIEGDDRLLGFQMYSDGSQNSSLNLAYKGEDRQIQDNLKINQGTYQPVTMNGKDVYRFAVGKVPEVIEKTLFNANLTIDRVDWLILHQANQRIIDAVAERLKLPASKVISNLHEYGNTSAASIPIALDEAVRSGKIQAGETIVTSGFGAGLSWGAAIFKWQ